MNNLLILGARANQLAAIRTAKTMGLGVIALDPCPQAVGFEAADVSIVCDLADRHRLLEVAREHAIRGVFTMAADYPIPGLAEVCEALELPGLSRDAARVSTDKAEMRRRLVSAGIPSPRSYPARSGADIRRALGENRGPVVVKPRRSSGGRGVRLLRPEDPCADHESVFRRAQSQSWSDGVVVDEFIDGPEYSVEAVTQGGTSRVIAVTEKTTSGSPYFVETGHVVPAGLSPDDQRVLEDITLDAIVALGIDDSGSHTEIRWGTNGPRVIEVGARLGGGRIASDPVPLALGIDLVRAAIQLSVGQLPDLEPTRRRAAAVRFLTPPAGEVTRIGGVDACLRRPEVRALQIDVRPGDEVLPLRDNSGRVGFVICESHDRRSVLRKIETALAQIQVEVTTTGPVNTIVPH